MADIMVTPPNMSLRYDRLIGSLARVDGELAAELDQATVLLSTSAKQSPKQPYGTTRKKAGVPRQSSRRHTASAPAERPAETVAKVDLGQLEKPQELRDLDGAKRRHERMLYGLSRREQELLKATTEAERLPPPPQERIRDRRQREQEQERAARSSAGVDSQLTPRQQKLVGSSADLAPGSYATTAVCFKCGLPGHAGSACTKKLGPKQLRTTQVMLKQRAADKPLPPDAAKTSPLHVARSPRVARARATETPETPELTRPPKARVPMVKAAIQKEIERLQTQLDEVVSRETMHDAVLHIQSNLGTLEKTRGQPKFNPTVTDRWEEAKLPDGYDEMNAELDAAEAKAANGGASPNYNNSAFHIKIAREEGVRRKSTKKAIMARGTSPQLALRTELGKSQPIETYHVVPDLEDFDGSPSHDLGWQPPMESATVAIHQVFDK